MFRTVGDGVGGVGGVGVVLPKILFKTRVFEEKLNALEKVDFTAEHTATNHPQALYHAAVPIAHN